MTDMDNLVQLMKQLEDQLVVCMKCGMCQAVCPLYESTGVEADVARGKLALLDGLMKNRFDNPKPVQDRLNKCLLCGSCQASCPSGVNVLDIFIKARAILAGYMGLSPAKKLIFRSLLAHPDRFDNVARWGARFQNLFTKTASDVIGTSCARVISPLLGNRHFKPLAKTPFHKRVPEKNTKGGRSGIRVALYVGCLLDKVYPDIAQNVLEVLDYHGVDVFLPAGQACCGIPAISSGDTDTFSNLVAHNVERFSTHPYDYLVTACATCTSTIKKIWPLMIPDSSPIRKAVEKMAARTMDISQFIVEKAGGVAVSQSMDAQQKSITYHDPCHLKKSLGVDSQPRELIRANGDYCLKEMPGADRCCGMGGSFNLQYYDISSNIGNLKAENITSTGCSTVASGCPACMMQISDMLSKAGKKIEVRHTVEIYAESLKRV